MDYVRVQFDCRVIVGCHLTTWTKFKHVETSIPWLRETWERTPVLIQYLCESPTRVWAWVTEYMQVSMLVNNYAVFQSPTAVYGELLTILCL